MIRLIKKRPKHKKIKRFNLTRFISENLFLLSKIKPKVAQTNTSITALKRSLASGSGIPIAVIRIETPGKAAKAADNMMKNLFS